MESLLPLITFCFVTSATPGPNNILLTASGIRFGLRRSVPHILGIQAGVAVLLATCATGAGIVLLGLPWLGTGIKVAGTAYMLFLAWQLSRFSTPADGNGKDAAAGRPFTFIQAALFQVVNPKAWVMTLTAGSLFVPELESRPLSIALLCLTFFLVGMPSSGSWAVIGASIRHYLGDPRWQRTFSGVMVVLTLYTAVSLWFF